MTFLCCNLLCEMTAKGHQQWHYHIFSVNVQCIQSGPKKWGQWHECGWVPT